jgi:tellurite resistance protein TehA-like permease
MLFVTLADLSLTPFTLFLIIAGILLFTYIVTAVIYRSEVKEMEKEFIHQQDLSDRWG